MATIKAFIRTSTKKATDVNIRFRLSDGRAKQLFHKSELIIHSDLWDEKTQSVKARVVYDAEKRTNLNDAVNDRKKLINDLYNKESDKGGLTTYWLDDAIDRCLHPEKYILETEKPQTIFDSFDEFLIKHPLSTVRQNNFKVIKRALQRFELYKRHIITFENLTFDLLNEFKSFLVNEHNLFIDRPDIYERFPEKRTPQQRGQNTINDIFTKIRTFVIWANTPDPTTKIAKTTNNAFGVNGYKIDECIYGTPYYITIDERNQLYNADLTARPQLAIQRDIFVFQCLVGCRVGDLYAMTRDKVIDGAIEYVARKTKDKKKVTVCVPLNETAKEILSRYPGCKKILPFISEQKYNAAIKDMFLLSGLTRIVTTINPTSGEAETRPINEVASSHLARRCFVGNLYKQVQDPNLVGVLSGHKEGSKAFSRYREIDKDTKQKLVNLLM